MEIKLRRKVWAHFGLLGRTIQSISGKEAQTSQRGARGKLRPMARGAVTQLCLTSESGRQAGGPYPTLGKDIKTKQQQEPHTQRNL